MPPSFFVIYLLFVELGLYRLKRAIPLMCFHLLSCKDRRILTRLPLTQHAKSCEALRVRPLPLHVLPIHKRHLKVRKKENCSDNMLTKSRHG